MQNIVTGENNDPRSQQQQQRLDNVRPAVDLGELLVQGAAEGLRAQDTAAQLEALPPEDQLEPTDVPPVAAPGLVTPPPALFNTYEQNAPWLSGSPINTPNGLMERAGTMPTLPQQVQPSSPIVPRQNRLVSPALGGIGTSRATVDRQLGMMNRRERALFNEENRVTSPPNSRGGLGLDSTRSVLPRVNRYGVETVQPPPGRWDIFSELDQTWNVIATGIEGFVRDAISNERLDTGQPTANQQRFLDSAATWFESFAPYKNENNETQPYLYDPARGYWGEMGTGLRGLALYTVAMPGNLISAGLYTLGDHLGFGDQDNPDYHTRGYRFAQAFGGQDLGFTNVRDGTGNRYLSAIPENRPLHEQIGWGILGFIGDTVGLGWIDNAVSRGVQWGARRLTGRAAQATGAAPQVVPDLLSRIEQTENGTLNPPRPTSSVQSSAPNLSPATIEQQLPVSSNAPPAGMPRAPLGGNTALSQPPTNLPGSLLSQSDLVNPPQPRTILTPYELTQIGQREINPATGQPYIPSTINQLTGSQIGMLSYQYPNVFNPVQSPYPTMSIEDLAGIRVDPNIAETLDADIGGIVEDVRLSETIPETPPTTTLSEDTNLQTLDNSLPDQTPPQASSTGVSPHLRTVSYPDLVQMETRPFVRRNPFGDAPIDLFEMSDPFGRPPDDLFEMTDPFGRAPDDLYDPNDPFGRPPENLYQEGSQPYNPFGNPPAQMFEPIGQTRSQMRRSRFARQWNRAYGEALQSNRADVPTPSQQPLVQSAQLGQPAQTETPLPPEPDVQLQTQSLTDQTAPAAPTMVEEPLIPEPQLRTQQTQLDPQSSIPQVETTDLTSVDLDQPQLADELSTNIADVNQIPSSLESPSRREQIASGLQRNEPIGDYMPTELREEYNSRILRSGRWTEAELRNQISFALLLKQQGFENESISLFESLQSARREGAFDVNRIIKEERTAWERALKEESIPPELIDSPIHQPEVRALTQEVYPQADFTPAVDYVRMTDEVSYVGRAEAQVTAELSELTKKYRQIVDDLKGLPRGLLRGNIADELGVDTLYNQNTVERLSPIRRRATTEQPTREIVAYHGTKQNNIVDISPNLGGSSNEFGAGLYLTGRPQDAGLYAQSGRNLTQRLSPTTNLAERGNIFQVTLAPRKTLDLSQSPPTGTEQIFRAAVRDTFDDPRLANQYAKDIQGVLPERWWTQLRETWAKMYRNRPMSERTYQKFQREVSRGLQEQFGYDTLYDPKRGYWVVLDNESGRMPVKAELVQAGVGTGSAMEAKLAQRRIDANMRRAMNNPVTRAWEQQSRKAYYAQNLDELIKDYESTLKQSTHTAERYTRADWNAMNNNLDNADQQIQNAVEQVKSDVERINRMYKVEDDNICL